MEAKIQKLDNNIWKSLFYMTKAYSDVETQACSFRLLILSMSYMISNIATRYSSEFGRFNNLKMRFCNTIIFFEKMGCNCDSAFKSVCPSSDKLFNLMKQYYNFCASRENKIIKKYSDFDREFDENKITKGVWGPTIWNIIHMFAAFYDQTAEYFTSYKCFVMCLTHTLPCSECRMHFLKHITKPENNINKFSKTNTDLLYWSFNIHNAANLSLNKPLFEWKNAYEMYIVGK